MIATVQKENFKEEKVTEKFSIISNRISDYRLKPRNAVLTKKTVDAAIRRRLEIVF